LVDDAPLSYASNRTLDAVDILGTQVLSMICGHYRFAHIKQKMTKFTRPLVKELDLLGGWIDAGQGWEGKESTLKLSTWQKPRRIVILRRPDPGPRYPRTKDIAAAKQPKLELIDCCLPHIVAASTTARSISHCLSVMPTSPVHRRARLEFRRAARSRR
jgi:hypothetical protein